MCIRWFVDGRLRSLRRWTTIGQSAERHPTAPPRWWQAFFARPARASPIRASHRRDDSVSRDDPHVCFAYGAFALKGPDMSAQGKATRVVRASPSPWVAYLPTNDTGHAGGPSAPTIIDR